MPTVIENALAAVRANVELNWREVVFSTSDNSQSVTVPCNVSGVDTDRGFEEGEQRTERIVFRHVETAALETGLGRPIRALDFAAIGGKKYVVTDTQRHHVTTTVTATSVVAVTRHATGVSGR